MNKTIGIFMAYWWVNLGDTYDFAIDNEFLWAPKVDKGNKTPAHWKTMYQVEEGDTIFSYAKGFVRAYSTVINAAYDFEKPFDENIENEWEKSGNRIDLQCTKIKHPIPLKSFSHDLFRIQEPLNSPINKVFGVNQGYLYFLNDLSGKVLLKAVNKTNAINLQLKRSIIEIYHKTSIISAIKEHDILGNKAFLNKYGFEQARTYLLYYNNRLYDSKAIVGVAYKYEYPTEEYLHSEEFSGGKKTVVSLLTNLGFEVIEKTITSAAYIALKQLSKESSIKEIKDVILTNKLYDFGAQDIDDVIKKQMERYCNNVQRDQKHNRKLFHKLNSSTYTLIEFIANSNTIEDEVDGLDYTYESSTEGTKKSKYTSYYERDPKLRKRALQFHGVTCYSCGFNFEQFYGEYAKDYIHIHHTKPLFENEDKVSVDPIKDLVPVCANCHSVIHRRKATTKSVEEIQDMIKQQHMKNI